MTAPSWWESLSHTGLLLGPGQPEKLAEAHQPPPLSTYTQDRLRHEVSRLISGDAKAPEFVSWALEKVCLLGQEGHGLWSRATRVDPKWRVPLVAGGHHKPDHLWHGPHGGVLPVFFDDAKRLGVGRSRTSVSDTLQWLRRVGRPFALLTNGRQWRLLYAGLDNDASCEWDADLWFEGGAPGPQLTALRVLFQCAVLDRTAGGTDPPLLAAVNDSRSGVSQLSADLGERVREAVEELVRAHGTALSRLDPPVPGADIYRAAVRVVMRMVVVMFAESRELLPLSNPVYHDGYSLKGLLRELQREHTRSKERLQHRQGAWPRVLSLFRLVYEGSHHEALPVPAYGGGLFAPGAADAAEPLARALHVFESACFDSTLATVQPVHDATVHKVLQFLSVARVKVRQGNRNTLVAMPVNFSELSSEYVGILYEGLLDYELKTAPADAPMIFLAVGNQPALSLARLELMDDNAIADLLEKMKQKSGSGDEEGEEADEETEAGYEEVDAAAKKPEEDDAVEEEPEGDAEEPDDPRHAVRLRAEGWARHAVVVGKLVPAPRGRLTPAQRRVHEETVAGKARQLVARVILPGEWYLVRWGGTRKGAGTFYTRRGLAVPTVVRTLRPLACDPPTGAAIRHETDAAAADAPGIGASEVNAKAAAWTPKRPEEILALRICDPTSGSGSFHVAALRYLTDVLYDALYAHGRLEGEQWRLPLESILGLADQPRAGNVSDPREFLPVPPGEPDFEPRTKAVLRRYVVERCLYGADIDPLAVELCRLALWVETMDKNLPFSFLDHKIKCGNSLVGAWFGTFRHYPAMAWKSREGGDKSHTNGVHFQKEARTKALKAFVQERLKDDLAAAVGQQMHLYAPPAATIEAAHDEALALLDLLHALPMHEAAGRSRLYHEQFLDSPAYRSLKEALDLWCACWFWPAAELDLAPMPTSFHSPPEATRALAARVAAQKRFFHWELEFPDVFRAPGSGFDAVLGNPPWNIAKPSSKEFFSNIDPLYRSYGKQEALRRQSAYFSDEAIERDWLDYQGDFRAQSNFVKFAAHPFGDPQASEDAADRFSIQRGKANELLHARWRVLREKDRGYADPCRPFRHQGSADLNLYKLFLEQAHALLRPDGRLGFIVPSGLYSDHGTGDLRRLFLDHCRWEWLFGFENREKIFDIDGRFKFNPVIIAKGGRTEALRTAFMRRSLADWERAEEHVTLYDRDRVERFSPRSRAILEIQSARDLEILEKIYANSVLLGDDGPDGWGITYATEFHMTNDSKLFPPRPKWEADGYRPDEYSRWLKGDWRPIVELWAELGVEPPPEGERRCAQPPYDRLPLPRADVPPGVILSRDADAWIREERIEDTALPLYEGRMIGQFDFSQKGWVSGKGRTAVWRDIPWDQKRIEPQFLMAATTFQEEALRSHFKAFRDLHGDDAAKEEEERLSDTMNLAAWWLAHRRRCGFMDVSSATNTRTVISSNPMHAPFGNKVPCLDSRNSSVLSLLMNSFAFDYVMRRRMTGLTLNYFIVAETPLPPRETVARWLRDLDPLSLSIAMPAVLFSPEWLLLKGTEETTAWKNCWALTQGERLRQRCIADAVSATLLGLDGDSFAEVLSECAFPSPGSRSLDPKGFWRVDKAKEPELRQTVLTLVAFHDLQKKIEECGGDPDKGIAAFCSQNDGEGWLLPETLRLADYGLGHDDRAKHPQPVASRLGPRFYDWQLAQTPEESWRECHLHARNLLGEEGYQSLLAEMHGGGTQGTRPPGNAPKAVVEPKQDSAQGRLF